MPWMRAAVRPWVDLGSAGEAHSSRPKGRSGPGRSCRDALCLLPSSTGRRRRLGRFSMASILSKPMLSSEVQRLPRSSSSTSMTSVEWVCRTIG